MDYILKKNPIFKNPNNVALNVLNLEYKNIRKLKKISKEHNIEDLKEVLSNNYEVRIEKYPALHKIWIQNGGRVFHLYQPFYKEVNENTEDIRHFVENNEKFLSSLRFLLQCSYHQFWCYITQDFQVSMCLRSFLFNYTPVHEFSSMDSQCLNVYNQILEVFAQIYVRLLTFKNSAQEFMAENVVLKFLEEKKLLNFSVVVNLCAIYHRFNGNLIGEVVTTYFRGHKQKKDETEKMFNHINLVFEMLGGEICGFEDTSNIVPIGIPRKPRTFDMNWYHDASNYLLDVLTTLNAFLNHTADWSIKAFCDMGIPHTLAYFYNQVYPKIYAILDDRRSMPAEWKTLKATTLKLIAKGRSECVNCYHNCVAYFIDRIIENQGSHDKQDIFLEEYIKLINAAAEDELFMFDYHNVNPVDLQLQLISEYYPELDTVRTNYILDCLSTLPKLQNEFATNPPKKQAINNAPSTSGQQTSKEPKKPSDDEIEERIRTVLDALPHLGDGFILHCLEYYNYDPVEVISAILDANLPPILADIKQDMIRVPDEPAPRQPTLAYRGKKPSHEDAIQLLNDKSDLKYVKDFILKKSTEINAYDNIYDDEYDDRDDYVPPSAHMKPKDAEEDPYGYMENRFEGYEMVSDPSSSSDEETKPQVAVAKKKGEFVPFCMDPSKIRESCEAARRAKSGNKQQNLVGKPKGQGQDASVLKQRDKKTVNKSSRANHNRKGGAEFKRNRGMF